MNDQKNIDRLFQERFKDFESEPNELIWKNIQASLSKKKKEPKIIPFWLRFSGIAATFLLGTATLNSVFIIKEGNKNGIVLVNNVLDKGLGDDNFVFDKKNSTITTNFLKEKLKENQLVTSTNNQKTVSNHEKSITIIVQSKPLDSKKANKNYFNSNFAKNNSSVTESFTLGKPKFKPVLGVTNISINTNYFNDYLDENRLNNNRIATTKKGDNNTNASEAKRDHVATDVSISIPVNVPFASHSNLNKPTKEYLKTVPSIPNELEELLKKKESEKKQVVVLSSKKWQITPNIAPVFLNSNSKGSPIDAQFSENDKNYENNISLGLGVNYAVSSKIAIRTGINKLALGFNTNNVTYYAGLNNNTLSGIAYNNNAEAITVVNSSVVTELIAFEKDIQNTNEGTLNQKMGYYEVPLEVSYAVLDKKFGIRLIGGVSTLFLDENKVSLVALHSRVDLGKANNLNQVHFSTNIGLGLKYEFLKSFHVNIEPMFKYQINTYSKEAKDFNPFIIGLYSGISYNF